MVCHLSHLFLPLHPGAHHCLSSILLLVPCTTGTGHRHRPTAIPCRCTPHWAPCLVSPRQSFPASPFHRPLAHMAATTKHPRPSHSLRLPIPAILPIHQHLAPQPHQTMPHPILPTLYLYPKTGYRTMNTWTPVAALATSVVLDLLSRPLGLEKKDSLVFLSPACIQPTFSTKDGTVIGFAGSQRARKLTSLLLAPKPKWYWQENYCHKLGLRAWTLMLQPPILPSKPKPHRPKTLL